jgi:hypothetical protein
MDLTPMLVRVGSHRVAGDADPLVVDRSSWSALRPVLSENRLTGVATSMLDTGALRLDPDDANELRRLDERWIVRRRRAEQLLLQVNEIFTTAGVHKRVLKGSALASLDWSRGNERRWVDVDVLVPGERIDECVALLTAIGATRDRPQIRPGFDRQFAKSVTMRSVGGIQIDLHRALVLGPHTFVVPTADLWCEPRRFLLHDVELSTMSHEATMVHVCMHATIAGASRIGSLRDVVEVFDGCGPDRTAQVAQRWRAATTVRMAGQAVATRLGLADHEFVQCATSLPVDGRDVRLARVYAPERRNNRTLALASVKHVPGTLAKVDFVRSMLTASRENYVRRRHSGRGSP